jgi:hypothetical protein
MAIELHSIELKSLYDFSILEIRIIEKLTEEDFGIMVLEIEKQSLQKQIRIFVELVNFSGWSAGVLWSETKFGLRRFSDVQKIAIVGEKFWAKGMADFCKPFIEAQWRYYDPGMIEEARKWTREKDHKETLFH